MKKAIILLPCLFILTACPLEDKDKKISELENKILLLENRPTSPRYQIIMNPQYAGFHTYLLDTQKGKIWQKVELTDVEGKPSVWSEQDIMDNTGEIGITWSSFMSYHKPIEKKSKQQQTAP